MRQNSIKNLSIKIVFFLPKIIEIMFLAGFWPGSGSGSFGQFILSQMFLKDFWCILCFWVVIPYVVNLKVWQNISGKLRNLTRRYQKKNFGRTRRCRSKSTTNQKVLKLFTRSSLIWGTLLFPWIWRKAIISKQNKIY